MGQKPRLAPYGGSGVTLIPSDSTPLRTLSVLFQQAATPVACSIPADADSGAWAEKGSQFDARPLLCGASRGFLFKGDPRMIALYFVLMSLRLAPVTTDAAMVARMELGQAVEDEGATPYEARWLAAVAYRESTYKLDAVGDNGSSFCAYQLHLPGGAKTGEGKTGEDLRKDARACTRQALKWLRWSLNACKSLPEAERIAGYARGRCESATGQRLSRDRWAQAQKAKLPGTAFAR